MTLSGPFIPIEEVLHKANLIVAWLDEGPTTTLLLSVSPTTYEQSGTAHYPTKYGPGGHVQLSDTQQVTLTVQPVDSAGNPTTDSNLTWTSADSTIIDAQPSADGTSCLCVARALGTGCVVTVSDGTRTATESFDVIGGAVAALNISAGQPQDQPAAPAGP